MHALSLSLSLSSHNYVYQSLTTTTKKEALDDNYHNCAVPDIHRSTESGRGQPPPIELDTYQDPSIEMLKPAPYQDSAATQYETTPIGDCQESDRDSYEAPLTTTYQDPQYETIPTGDLRPVPDKKEAEVDSYQTPPAIYQDPTTCVIIPSMTTPTGDDLYAIPDKKKVDINPPATCPDPQYETIPTDGLCPVPDKKEAKVDSYQTPPAIYQDTATCMIIPSTTTSIGDLYAIPDKKKIDINPPARDPQYETIPTDDLCPIRDKKEADVDSYMYRAPPTIYQDPAAIQYEIIPTGTLCLAVPDKKEANVDSYMYRAPPTIYQDPATVQHETGPTGDLYAIPDKKEVDISYQPPATYQDPQYETIPTDNLCPMPDYDKKEAEVDSYQAPPTATCTYQDPTTITHETAPTGDLYTIPDKKESDVTIHQAPPIESVAAYQDPATTDHIRYETMCTLTGDLYSIPDKKEAGYQAPPIEPAAYQGPATQYETIPTDDLYAIPDKKEANPAPPIEPADSATQYETIPTDDLYAIPDNKEADASYPAPTEPATYLVPATTQHEAGNLPKLVYCTHHMYMYRPFMCAWVKVF